MKKTLGIIYLLFFVSVISFSQQADEIVGKYHLPNGLDIELFSKNNKYFGKIIALNDFEKGQIKDINNPEKSKRKDNLLGKVIIENLEHDSKEKKWINGIMYGPEKGMFFNLEIKENKKDAIVIEASKFIFWKTMEWEKL